MESILTVEQGKLSKSRKGEKKHVEIILNTQSVGTGTNLTSYIYYSVTLHLHKFLKSLDFEDTAYFILLTIPPSNIMIISLAECNEDNRYT